MIIIILVSSSVLEKIEFHGGVSEHANSPTGFFRGNSDPKPKARPSIFYLAGGITSMLTAGSSRFCTSDPLLNNWPVRTPTGPTVVRRLFPLASPSRRFLPGLHNQGPLPSITLWSRYLLILTRYPYRKDMLKRLGCGLLLFSPASGQTGILLSSEQNQHPTRN